MPEEFVNAYHRAFESESLLKVPGSGSASDGLRGLSPLRIPQLWRLSVEMFLTLIHSRGMLIMGFFAPCLRQAFFVRSSRIFDAFAVRSNGRP